MDAENKEAASDPTPEKVQKYIDCCGSFCLYCGSDDISAGKLEADGDQAWSPVTCQTCEREWQDVYHLAAVDIFDDALRLKGTIEPPPKSIDVNGLRTQTTESEMNDATEVTNAELDELIESLTRFVEVLERFHTAHPGYFANFNDNMPAEQRRHFELAFKRLDERMSKLIDD